MSTSVALRGALPGQQGNLMSPHVLWLLEGTLAFVLVAAGRRPEKGEEVMYG